MNEALLSNAVATANLLEFAPEFGRFVYISSSEVYGYQTAVPFSEGFTPFPISPYAIGKYAGELYARMKRHVTNQPIVCVRPFNTFGPYQSERAVIPELIVRCLRGLPVETTEGIQTREFNYVDNIIDAFVMVAGMSAPPADQVVNIGSNREIAIRDLVRRIHEATGSKSELRIGHLPNRPTEIWRMCADNERAVELLGWTPQVTFEEGLERTVAWHRRYLDVFINPDRPSTSCDAGAPCMRIGISGCRAHRRVSLRFLPGRARRDRPDAFTRRGAGIRTGVRTRRVAWVLILGPPRRFPGASRTPWRVRQQHGGDAPGPGDRRLPGSSFLFMSSTSTGGRSTSPSTSPLPSRP